MGYHFMTKKKVLTIVLLAIALIALIKIVDRIVVYLIPVFLPGGL